MATITQSTLDDIIPRSYTSFRGVDFSNNDVVSTRSPDSINMWRKYDENDCIQTRPGLKLLDNLELTILGLFFLNKDDILHVLIHSGTKLYTWDNYPTTPMEVTEIYSGMNIVESRSFIFDNTLFIMDGINYLEYDGETLLPVVGTTPVTSYWKDPSGETSIDEDTDTDLVYQAVNVLTSLRTNYFVGDGESTDYYLDTTDLDSASTYLVTAIVDDVEYVENVDFEVDRENGIITFNSDKIPESDTKVYITFSKTTSGYKDRILNCSLVCEFDNRIFFSGNPNYPNTVFHCELNDPRYVRDTAYYECGLDLANIKAIVPGNNVLWVIKEIEQNSSSIYYLTPTLDSTYNKIYPSVNGSITLGCSSLGLNFNDDIVFFSNRGLEGVSSSSMYSEQILSHRSSLVDTKMLQEDGYEDVKVAEYKGYLMCLINSHIYLADSRKVFQNSSGDTEYEWFYWELPNNITFMKEYRQNLYLGNENGDLYILDGTTDNEEDIYSCWTTPKDDFGYPGYSKTTNKRGNVANVLTMGNDEIKIDTIVEGTLKEKTTLSDEKGYLVFRIRDKKFKEIQLKFSSNKPFGIFSAYIQGFIAGYIKR